MSTAPPKGMSFALLQSRPAIASPRLIAAHASARHGTEMHMLRQEISSTVFLRFPTLYGDERLKTLIKTLGARIPERIDTQQLVRDVRCCDIGLESFNYKGIIVIREPCELLDAFRMLMRTSRNANSALDELKTIAIDDIDHQTCIRAIIARLRDNEDSIVRDLTHRMINALEWRGSPVGDANVHRASVPCVDELARCLETAVMGIAFSLTKPADCQHQFPADANQLLRCFKNANDVSHDLLTCLSDFAQRCADGGSAQKRIASDLN